MRPGRTDPVHKVKDEGVGNVGFAVSSQFLVKTGRELLLDMNSNLERADLTALAA